MPADDPFDTERLRADPTDPCVVVKRANVPAEDREAARSIHQSAVALAREVGGHHRPDIPRGAISALLTLEEQR